MASEACKTTPKFLEKLPTDLIIILILRAIRCHLTS